MTLASKFFCGRTFSISTPCKTPHTQKQVFCPHVRHKNRFQNFQKTTVLAIFSEKIVLQNWGHFTWFFKRKIFFSETWPKSLNQILRMFWSQLKPRRYLEHSKRTFVGLSRTSKNRVVSQKWRNRPFSSTYTWAVYEKNP